MIQIVNFSSCYILRKLIISVSKNSGKRNIVDSCQNLKILETVAPTLNCTNLELLNYIKKKPYVNEKGGVYSIYITYFTYIHRAYKPCLVLDF